MPCPSDAAGPLSGATMANLSSAWAVEIDTTLASNAIQNRRIAPLLYLLARFIAEYSLIARHGCLSTFFKNTFKNTFKNISKNIFKTVL
jgi:hypothetical protein